MKIVEVKVWLLGLKYGYLDVLVLYFSRLIKSQCLIISSKISLFRIYYSEYIQQQKICTCKMKQDVYKE